MKAAIYARVSTDDQNTDLQMRELRAYCQARDWEITEYIDHGVSGRKDRRPELDRLWTDVKAGKAEVVVVWAFDRLGRRALSMIAALEEFQRLGVGFVSLKQQMDTTAPMGKAVFTILAAIAELESAHIGMRVKAGMAAARAAGKQISRPRQVPRLEIQRMAKAGKEPAEIAQTLRVHAATVRRILRKELKCA